MKISVIIPTYNEKTGINILIEHLYRSSSDSNNFEIIVADYSNKETLNFISNKDVVKIDCRKKGRASQMNEGALYASNLILYFLHADSFPPSNWDILILKRVNKGFEIGCFRLKFDLNHWLLNFSSWCTKFNSITFRGGDQSLFITEKLFKKIGRFDEIPLFEDLEIIRKAKRFSKFGIIPAYILTSARRYNCNGVFYLQYHFALLHLKYRFGVNFNKLKTYYLKHIK